MFLDIHNAGDRIENAGRARLRVGFGDGPRKLPERNVLFVAQQLHQGLKSHDIISVARA